MKNDMHVMSSCFYKLWQQFLLKYITQKNWAVASSLCVWTKRSTTPQKRNIWVTFLWELHWKKHHSREVSGIRTLAFPSCWSPSFMHSKALRSAELITSAWWPEKCAAWKLKRWRVKARESQIICSFKSGPTVYCFPPPGGHMTSPTGESHSTVPPLHEFWHFHF